MKRAFFLAGFVLLIDQLTKLYFQMNFEGKRVILFGKWGFTYVTNPGIWINPNISGGLIHVVQIATILIYLIIFYLFKYYKIYYRDSIWMDLSFAFFSTSCFGNIFIDRIFFNFVRDFFINPIATSNLADICGETALFFFIIETIVYPGARKLWKQCSPRDCCMGIKKIVGFVKGDQ